jgi:hypothetical protein
MPRGNEVVMERLHLNRVAERMGRASLRIFIVAEL